MLKAYSKKCPYSELFWSAYPRIRTEYGDLQIKSPYSVQMRKNKDQKNSEYVHFSRIEVLSTNSNWKIEDLKDRYSLVPSFFN